MPRYNILIGCDQNYYDEWAISCLESLQKNIPWINLHCHVVNPVDLYKIPGVNYTTEEKDFLSETHRISYLQCVRFIVVPRLFKSDELVMSMDCDTVCLKSFTEDEFESIATRVSVLQHPKSLRWLAGLVTYGTNQFRSRLVEEIYADDEDFWHIGRDQDVLQDLNLEFKFGSLNSDWMSIGKATKNSIFLTLKGEQKIQTPYVESYVKHFNKTVYNQIEEEKVTNQIFHIHLEDQENLVELTNPFSYFNHIEDAEYIKLEGLKNRIKGGLHGGHIILSGNISLDAEKTQIKLEEFTNYQYRSVTIWNGRFDQVIHNPIEYYSVLDKVELISFRENFGSNTWVPCVSCMHEYFNDSPVKTSNSILAIYDKKKKIKKPPPIATITDDLKFKDLCNLIKQSEVIVTNSYYGAYWSMLLNKKVLVLDDIDPRIHLLPIPYVKTSNKFFTNIKTFSANKEFLSICRRRNIEFYEKLKTQINPENE